MRNLRLPIFVFFFLTVSIVNAQNKDSESFLNLKKSAESLYEDEQYRNALPYYEKALQLEPNNPDLLFKTGVCYLNKYSKEKALEYMEKAFALDSTINKHIHYWMGKAYHDNYFFDKAIQNYSFYKTTLGKKDPRHKHVNELIAQSQRAKDLVAHPKKHIVRNLGSNINSAFSEHSPVISSKGDMMLFTSRRETVTGGKEDYDGEFFEDIFVSKKGADGEWSKPEIIHLNTSGHDASIQLLENDSKLLIYRGGEGNGDIYITEREGDNWKTPVKFANINTNDFEADAYISKDGQTAFYATNYHKKHGDLDIHYITKNHNNHWSHPHHVKGKINSKEDEMAPFLTPDGKTLYFSSRGHSSIGGYDIFKSTKDDHGHWSEPENLGYPINTPDDDVYFYQSDDGKVAYIASYREGGLGEKDIYEVIQYYDANVRGSVTSQKGTPLNDVKVVFTSLDSTVKSHVNTNNGNFNIKLGSNMEYNVAILKGNDTLYKEQFELPANFNEKEPFSKNFNIDYIAAEDTAFVSKDEEKHEINFKNIYFTTGKFELSQESKKELNIIKDYMLKNPEVELEIGGHADAAGERESVNWILSEKRAQAAAFYLVQCGIKHTRLKYKGYGSKNPIGNNDSAEGMKLNRRIEFKILK